MAENWGFYGRRTELEQIRRILERRRWFFLKISGRRRIGKTSLIQQARREEDKIVYIQIPDSDPAGVVAAVRGFMDMFELPGPRPNDLASFASAIGDMVRQGYVVAIDEFQYFNRKVLNEFLSHLQYQIDRLAESADQVSGGLIVLGSIHTEMSALLEDRSAPLYNRVTDNIDLPHLDIESVSEILREHADDSPERLLFIWNLFEGVPKFYRDCFEQGVLGADRKVLIERMFLSSSSPLRAEADTWFLKELHGRYDLVLRYIAEHPGCTNADLDDHARSVVADGDRQVGGYLKILCDKYDMVERLLPVFSRPKARRGRYYIKDNFLRSWLAALAMPSAATNFRPLPLLVDEADRRLMVAEGHGFERLVWAIYSELGRKGLGDFGMTRQVQGYWDRSDVEIDLVAVNDDARTIRFGTCKRDEDRLVAGISTFNDHVARFLGAFPEYEQWTIQRIGHAPRLSATNRKLLAERGLLSQDLNDFVGLLPDGVR